MTSLAGQLALVTGASGGIGGAIATALSRQSARLVILGRDKAKLGNLAERLSAAPEEIEARSCDLTIDDEVERLCASLALERERLDILVLCAGVIDHGRLAEAPIAALDRQYLANVRGPLLLIQKLLPLLKKPRGQIVFINSSAGMSVRPNTGHFCATQHAFKVLADTLRQEVNADGIRILSVFPGRTATERIRSLHAKEGRDFQPELLLQPEEVASVVVNALSLPWTAEVTDISIRPMQKSY